jgi:hypothetical protein
VHPNLLERTAGIRLHVAGDVHGFSGVPRADQRRGKLHAIGFKERDGRTRQREARLAPAAHAPAELHIVNDVGPAARHRRVRAGGVGHACEQQRRRHGVAVRPMGRCVRY